MISYIFDAAYYYCYDVDAVFFVTIFFHSEALLSTDVNLFLAVYFFILLL